MWLLAFHGFLRIGEITARSAKAYTASNLQLQDCTVNSKQGKLLSVDIVIQNGKHSQGQAFKISTPSNNPKYCPVQAIHSYLLLARPLSGPLFQFPGGTPVNRHFFDHQLKTTLQAAGLDTKVYTGHSFRIGAASQAVTSLGLSEHEVQKLGRWNSNAFKSYIRIPQFTIPT